MNKLNMHTQNQVDINIRRIGELFPNALTERKNEKGEVERAIDFDVLRQELSQVLVEGPQERYQFSWPDKRKAQLLANAPISETLRPCREESVDFDSTENLYIEGDNLNVLKLLQETYLGKVKMIYIDPPYNTGNDFVYEDDYSQSAEEYLAISGTYDEGGQRMVKNLDSNGRYHTDWLNMMYPRLRLAKDLLTEDGAVLVSIDDNEQANVQKLLNDIFGENNKAAEMIVIRAEGGGLAKQVIKGHDYLLLYAKNISVFTPLGKPKDIRGKIIERNGETYWIQEDWLRKEFGKYGNCHYEEVLEYKGDKVKREIDDGLASGKYILMPKSNGLNIVGKLRNVKEDSSKFYSILKHLSADGIKDLMHLELNEFFDYPKPLSLLKEVVLGMTIFSKNGIILDFFSGSATTAHAVMQLNAEDGGKRKFIMVQLPEETDEKSEAYKAGYKNICEIGKERIRRAGAKIKEELQQQNQQLKLGEEPKELPDTGFRVLKLASSNMKDVYYAPQDYTQARIDDLIDNIKEGRTPQDLLFQVMLELGVLLSSPISESDVNGQKVFSVADGFLMACFDSNIKEDTITHIAKQKPHYAVFRDSGYATDSVAVNFEQIFKAYSPDTVRRVL